MRRKEGDKYSLILEAAIRVFHNEGFDKAQVAAIASDAGVATGSVYLYFKSKNDLLDSLFSRFWQAMLEQYDALHAVHPKEFIRELLSLFFDHIAADPAFTVVYLKEHHRFLAHKENEGYNAYVRCLEIGADVFERGVKMGCFRSGMNQDLARSFLFGGLRSSLEFAIANPKIPLKDVRSQMLQLALAAIEVDV